MNRWGVPDEIDLQRDESPDDFSIDGEGRVSPTELWGSFGDWLRAERKRRGLKIREAAARANISPSSWSILESGGRMTRGEWVVPSPSDVMLVRIAKAVEEDPFDVFERAQREWDEALDPLPPEPAEPQLAASGSVDVSDLSEDDRARVLDLVERLRGR
jgi:transcriptional regulator with XRE-family HTH domain